MKIISIISSCRKNGNTDNVVKLIEKQITKNLEKKNISIHIERIFLGHRNIQFCKGCRVCFDKGEEKCQFEDDVLSIRDKMLDADGIIIASPVYVDDINGIMKNWIDRMAFNNHRPGFPGKTAFLITTSAIGSSNHSLKTMKKALNAWGFYIIGQSNFRTGTLMNSKELNDLFNNKSMKIANKITKAIIKNKSSRPTFYSLISFKIQQKYWQKVDVNKNNSYDHKYWCEKDWIKPECKYYIKHKYNPIKVSIARIIGSIIAVFLFNG